MPKNVTIKDIAAEAGVSIALVSFVMNNRIEADGKHKYRVNENTRRRVLEVARRLNYQPNSAARTLRKGRSLVIGVILSDISNVFYGEIAKQLEELAFKHGYTVLFGSSDESPDKFDKIMRSFIDKGVEGFIVVPCEGSEKSLKYVMDIGIPLVVMDRRSPEISAPKVVLDNEDAMRQAVSILVSQGIREIEMISYTMRVSSISGREKGFIKAMLEAGADNSDIRIHHLNFDNIHDETDAVIPGIVERKVKGLVFATNTLAISAIKKLSLMGIQVQKDICLVGFDSSDAYDLFNPPIPHVCQPIDKICAESFRLLKQLMDKEIPQESQVITLPAKVVNI